MLFAVPLTPSQISATTRLFSSAVFREMAKKGRSGAFARLFSQLDASPLRVCGTVGDAFEAAFQILKTEGLRDEYIYRAAVTQKVLLGKHSLNTASMLTEFRAGTCKADLVILNGTASVYEIKSERDSLDRLENQIESYRKVFATINVIAGESHVAKIQQLVPKEVGIMSLSRRYQISTIRDATELPGYTNPISVFESLRSAEARAVLDDFGVDVPNVPNTRLHAAMRECFSRLPAEDVQRSMVKVLKRTRNLAPLSELIGQLPRSLHAAALSTRVNSSERDRLVRAVHTPLDVARGWA
ncbi:sce7726 family protein [Bradyrhizobium sp. SZCCHNS2096]|uniref:sce7726 family protein n=1 Tax=Bradyrhizobium sp. SZCCHNS2096 TaxID=3057309 RepID=UPI0029171108|nr:sce7726 family protein [Bradyrhizobium sp. SZCCHNS2096]